jgi:FkbH-like protein
LSPLRATTFCAILEHLTVFRVDEGIGLTDFVDDDSRYPFFQYIIEPVMHTQTIAVAATFTADPLALPISFWMKELDLPLAVQIAPYNQVFQQLLDPGSLFSQNKTGINVILVRAEDWQRFEGGIAAWAADPATVEARIERNLGDLISAIASASHRSATPHLVALCPPSDAARAEALRETFLKRIEERFASAFAAQSSVYPLLQSELEALYPVAAVDFRHGDEIGHIPYTTAFFTGMGSLIARKIYALRSPPRKVIAVDCDETLWKGIVGEVGPMGVELDAPRRAVQELLVRQKDSGMVLCVTSKNVEQDVLDVWKTRPEMPLRREQFVGTRINWQRKSDNLRSLSAELGLGLDSFILLDDNPVECAEVAATCPEVLALELPQPVETIPAFLQHVWAFDHLRVTAEDRERTALYQQNAERERVRKGSPTLADFLAGLSLEVKIEPPFLAQIARVAQLTQRTNQFNCTTRRRTEGEIVEICRAAPARVCLATEVRDRFGDYGLVGLVIAEPRGGALDVDTFLLSCRVLGRTIENRMLRKLGEIAAQRGLSRVDVHFIPTKKNQPARDFLEGAGAAYEEAEGDGFVVRFPATVAAELPLVPFVAEIPGGGEGAQRDATTGPAPSALLNRIARELRDVDAIRAAIAAYLRGGAQRETSPASGAPEEARDADTPARSPLEDKIAGIWSEVLAIDGIGMDQDFFELGGDSLTAAQVVARVRQAFEVHLPLDVLFEARTIAELAVTIVEALAEHDRGDDMESLLDEIEAS